MDVEMPGFGELVKLKDRGMPYWWLWVGRCPVCCESWLVAQEERAMDIVVMRRLSDAELRMIIDDDVWPDDFDSYTTLLSIEIELMQSSGDDDR